MSLSNIIKLIIVRSGNVEPFKLLPGDSMVEEKNTCRTQILFVLLNNCADKRYDNLFGGKTINTIAAFPRRSTSPTWRARLSSCTVFKDSHFMKVV